MKLSDSVGCAWIVAARSSARSAFSTASAPSAISSPAPGPTSPTPRTRPEAGSITSFVSPSERPRGAAALTPGAPPARIRADARGLEPQPLALRPAPHGHQHPVEGLAFAPLEARLDAGPAVRELGHASAQVDGGEQPLDTAGPGA